MRVEAWVRTCYHRAGQAPNDAVLARDVEDAMALWADIPESVMPNLLLNASKQAGRYVAKPAAVAKLWEDSQGPAQASNDRDFRVVNARNERNLEAAGGPPTREWMEQWSAAVRKQMGFR